MKTTSSIRKGVVGAFAIVALAAGIAYGHPNHWTSGTAGSHTLASHVYNPGHLAIALKAPGSGEISSGGRFHDVCTTTSCQGGDTNWNADWSLDIAAGGGTDVYLNADIDGAGSSTYVTRKPDNNKPMSVWAVAGPVGNFRTTGDAACYWQQFNLWASYTDIAGTPTGNLAVGSVWMAHINTIYANETKLPANLSRTNPAGTGTISYLSMKVGTVFSGGGKDPNPITGNLCSDGSHIHFEVFSKHGWGNEIEWHSRRGPDGYTNPGMANPNHIHNGTTVTPSGTATYTIVSGSTVVDSVTRNVTKLGWIGGDPTSFKLSDNPNTSDH